jgi:hypothetical protein
MTFLVRARAPVFEDQLSTQALQAWRAAESRVRERWDQFLVADREARPFTFAAYLAALDREATASDELAGLVCLDQAG